MKDMRNKLHYTSVTLLSSFTSVHSQQHNIMQTEQTTSTEQATTEVKLNNKQRRTLKKQKAEQLAASLLQPTADPNVKTTLNPTLQPVPIESIPFNHTSPEIARHNANKAQAREFANVTHAAEGLLIIENNDDDTVTYGFEDLRVWVPRDQKWHVLTAQDPDKFKVTAETHQLASSEFYARWREYTQKVFKTRIFITALNR